MDTLSALATVLAVMTPFLIIGIIVTLVIASIWFIIEKIRK
jgi:MFS superfamily sulfate permease-like transporter